MFQRQFVPLVLVGLLLATPGLGVVPAAAAPAPLCFTATNQCIDGAFLAYWQANGGLDRNGYPLTGQVRETLEDGREYVVQYFERVRLELHPQGNGTTTILLGQFGRRILREAYVVDRRAYRGAIARAEPIAGARYFEETGHNLGGRFLAYWEANGGLAQFGYPLTEERPNDSVDGGSYRTQYFERARFEYHPEHVGTPYEVQLGQFGRRILAESALLQEPFRTFFQTHGEAQVLLGAPTTTATTSAGATQRFEKGLMFYAQAAPAQHYLRGGFLDHQPPPAERAPLLAATQAQETEETIYPLCGDPESGGLFTPGRPGEGYFFRNAWSEGMPEGGGAGPSAGLYEPKRGFGVVWRGQPDEKGQTYRPARECLGYATTPDETAFRITVQYFQGGALLLSDTPGDHAIYLISVGRYTNSGGPSGAYARYPLPAR